MEHFTRMMVELEGGLSIYDLRFTIYDLRSRSGRCVMERNAVWPIGDGSGLIYSKALALARISDSMAVVRDAWLAQTMASG